jgi:hypothetical protein
MVMYLFTHKERAVVDKQSALSTPHGAQQGKFRTAKEP